MKHLKISWRRFDIAVEDFYHKYKSEGIERIVGISRGGLPLAVALSHRLKVPMEVLECQTRDGDGEVRGAINLSNPDKTLFVDDICDSGKTIKYLNTYFYNLDLRWVTLVEKKRGYVESSAVQMVENDPTWVIFPWE